MSVALRALQFELETKNVRQGAIMSLLRLRGGGKAGETCVISRHERTDADGGRTRARVLYSRHPWLVPTYATAVGLIRHRTANVGMHGTCTTCVPTVCTCALAVCRSRMTVLTQQIQARSGIQIKTDKTTSDY